MTLKYCKINKLLIIVNQNRNSDMVWLSVLEPKKDNFFYNDSYIISSKSIIKEIFLLIAENILNGEKPIILTAPPEFKSIEDVLHFLKENM